MQNDSGSERDARPPALFGVCLAPNILIHYHRRRPKGQSSNRVLLTPVHDDRRLLLLMGTQNPDLSRCIEFLLHHKPN